MIAKPLLVAVALIGYTLPAYAQVNKINSIVFGTRVPQFAGDPSGGLSFRESSADNEALAPAVAGAKIVVFSPKGGCFVTGSGSTMWLWNMRGEEIQVFPQNAPISSVSFNPLGTFVAIGGGRSVKVWSVPSGQFICELLHDSNIRSIIVSPNSKYIATMTASGFNLWDPQQGTKLLQISSPIGSLVFSPDSARFLTLNGTNVSLWRMTDDTPVGTLSHENPIRAAMFSPDGKFVISTTDRWAHLWDAQRFLKINDIQYGGSYR